MYKNATTIAFNTFDCFLTQQGKHLNENVDHKPDSELRLPAVELDKPTSAEGESSVFGSLHCVKERDHRDLHNANKSFLPYYDSTSAFLVF